MHWLQFFLSIPNAFIHLDLLARRLLATHNLNGVVENPIHQFYMQSCETNSCPVINHCLTFNASSDRQVFTYINQRIRRASYLDIVSLAYHSHTSYRTFQRTSYKHEIHRLDLKTFLLNAAEGTHSLAEALGRCREELVFLEQSEGSHRNSWIDQ